MARKVVPVERTRLEIILAPEVSGLTVKEVCERYGFSKTQFYEWLKRYQTEGVAGLSDRSSRPRSSPHRTDPAMERTVCALRVDHPDWGPRRIRAELRRRGASPPAASTIGAILTRSGLITPRPRRRRECKRFVRPSPNDLWQADAKKLWLADRTEVWAINFLDDHARFLIQSRASFLLDGEAAWEAFDLGISAHGLPREVLTDNGRYFSGKHWGLVAEFERKLWALGIKTIASRPKHPQTLGKIERFHRTLGEYLAGLEPVRTLVELQRQLDAFRWYYNERRPHQALIDDSTPRETYDATPHVGPEATQIERSVARKVQPNGTLRYGGWTVNVTQEWAAVTVEIVEGGGKVRVVFGDELIASFSIEEPKGYISSGYPRGPRGLTRRLPERR